MRLFIGKFITWLKSAFDTHSKGASARKLTAFAIVCCVMMIHTSWLKHAFMKEDFSLLLEILISDFSFILALLGLTTWEAVKKDKKDKTSDTNEQADADHSS